MLKPTGTKQTTFNLNDCLFMILFLFALLPMLAHAHIKQHQYNPQPVNAQQWQVTDIIFKAQTTVENPFEKNVFAIIKGEKEQTIPLFYNGDNQWVLRYSSAFIGDFNYEITSDIKAFNYLSGQFNITKNTKENRRGAVVLNSDDKQHFYYQDGSHYSNMAFELDWLFALDYGNKTLKKTNHLLDLVAKNGFNQVVTTVYSHDVSWDKDPILKDYPEYEYGGRQDIFPFLGSNENPDFSALNIEFFKHYDRIMSSLHEREIVNHLMIYVWNKMVNWPALGSAEDNRYFDYIIKRYQAFPNIIWDVSKEALHYENTTKGYISERISRIRQQDAFKRLVTVHDFGFCANHPDEVDFISTQDWKHTLYTTMLKVRARFPNKPIVNIEHGGYELSPIRVFPGAYEDPEVTLRRNYMNLFAGVYQTYYWQGTSWNVVIHDPFQTGSHFYKPKFEYYAVMSKLLDQFNFADFAPMPNRNGSGYNLTNEKTGTVLVFVPKENYSVTLGYLAKGKDKYRLKWLNTLTGEVNAEHEPEVHKGWFNNSPWRGQADTIVIATKITN
ncbi:apiosidase-like domain-containing protein [Algibacillus agarilyticus]|uniref:apiosidase-like domain-containing protein n=1 Tax=Algibacillus agarilyticus TaxID=2234133 RepID=UPI0018E526BC|nr:DUF4038 domain-containing protein [Algibacillus agarilyticus]